MIRSEQELKSVISAQTASLDAKFKDTKKRAVLVCAGTGCLSNKSQAILEKLQEVIKDRGLSDKFEASIAGCFGFCSQGPFIKIFPDELVYKAVTPEDVEEIVDKTLKEGEIIDRLIYVDPVTHQKAYKLEEMSFYKKQVRVALYGVGVINPENIQEALGYGAFQGLMRALKMQPQEVVDEVLKSGLRGRGGGGFPTGRKWQFALNQPAGTKYVVCNGDEGDPGAFMDSALLEGNPFAVIEGMMIAGYAIGAQNGYFYVRAEYPTAVRRLKNAIKQAKEIGLIGDHILGTDFSFDVHLRLGAGAFVCGEETALLNSIEGKRGMPRPRPPFPAVKGLWQHPSIINNVETLGTVPYILREGADKFITMGTEKSRGTKVFALAGKVNNVGLVEVPMGVTLRELVYDIGGGVAGGKQFKAIQTGGPSGGCLTVADLDTPIDYDNLIAKGSMMGSGGAIVMDEDNCMVDVAKFYMDFICDESCGKCSPCRIGTRRMLEILTKITDGKGTLEDLADLEELAVAVKSNSLCGLGQTAANPIVSTMSKFKDEYIAHVVDKKCPAHICKNLMEYVIDPDKCIGCGVCQRNCPTNAISRTDYIAEGHKLASMVIDASKCVKCGMCQSVCKFGAVSKR